jgi:hypothetical protein
MGVRNAVYVDNGRNVAASKEKANSVYGLTLDTFKSEGFVIAEEKSDARGSSSQRKEYLGFTIDTASFRVKVPENKLNRIKICFSDFLLLPRQKVRVIASQHAREADIPRASAGEFNLSGDEVGHYSRRCGHRSLRRVKEEAQPLGELDHSGF